MLDERVLISSIRFRVQGCALNQRTVHRSIHRFVSDLIYARYRDGYAISWKLHRPVVPVQKHIDVRCGRQAEGKRGRMR